MTSTAHRFLNQRRPGAAGSPPVWAIHGPCIGDLFYHDLLHGSVTLRRTLELWALSEWERNGAGAAQARTIVVRLSSTGDLDFSGNADPESAAELFDQMRSRRPPRYGQRRPRGSQAAPGDEERPEEATRAANSLRSSMGGGRGLVNHVGQLAAAMQSESGHRILVVVERFAEQIRGLYETNDAASANEVLRILHEEWLFKPSQTHAKLVFIASDRRELTEYIPAEQPDVQWIEVKGPSPEEITEALVRVSRRRGFTVREANAVGSHLAQYKSLRTALGNPARIVSSGRDVSMEAVIDLPPINDSAVAGILDELDALVGLDEVKTRARELVESARARRRRLEESGQFPAETMHLIFSGDPGTGKTTVARIIARLYHALGVLSTDRVKEVTASQGIMSPTVGQTEVNMQRMLEEAVGGVIFIDEAHQFGDKTDPRAAEAIKALVAMAENNRNNLVIILAGYSDQMPDLLAMDPGLPSRFPLHGRIEFTNYGPGELWEIMSRNLSGKGWELGPDAESGIRALLQRRCRRNGFGNARGIRNLVDEIVAIHDARPAARAGLISVDDLPAAIVRHEEEFAAAQQALDRLVGLGAVRTHIAGMVAEIAADLEEGTVGDYAPNMLFVGPPGTGKTTVARLMADLLYGIGAITRNKCVDVGGASLKGAYTGQTVPRVREAVERARDGVLLIDEAYAISSGEDDTFGQEALSELIRQVTLPDNKDTVFILAGYEHEIQELLKRNPGMKRRFETVIEFEPFQAEDCTALALRAFEAAGKTWEVGVPPAFTRAARSAINRQGSGFGNAGWAEGAAQATLKTLKGRAAREGIPANDQRRQVVTVADLESALEIGLVRHEEDLRAAQEELDALIGLSGVRDTLQRIAANLEYNQLHAEGADLRVPNMRFIGPPGTGKTTVARLLTRMLFGLGAIERKICVEASGASLKGAYSGHTVPKVKELFDRARGGVLFIDEAYGLIAGDHDQFGQEAVAELVMQVTAPQNQGTVVVLAGYEAEIESLLRANTGFGSRFATAIRFENFSPADCAELVRRHLESRGFTFDSELVSAVRAAASWEIDEQQQSFGNARWAESLAAGALSNMRQRVVSSRLPAGDPGARHVTLDDLASYLRVDAQELLTDERVRAPGPREAVEWQAPPGLGPLATAEPAPAEGDDLINRLLAASVHVLVETARGQFGATGFVVTPDGLIATNAHVVQGARRIEVRVGAARTAIHADLVLADADADLALLSARLGDELDLPCLALGSSYPLEPLHQLVVVGNASVMPGEPARTVHASVARNNPEDDRHFETDGAIEEGFSGGPALDPDSRSVVGVVVGGLAKTVKMMIRVEQLRRMLEQLGYRFEED